MSEKKKIAVVIGAAFALITALIMLAISIVTGETADSRSLWIGKPDAAYETPAPILPADRDAQYEARQVMPERIDTDLPRLISDRLSAGDFSGLDKELRFFQETYRENESELLSEVEVIDVYRADIAYYLAVSNTKNEPNPYWVFKNADALAAAVAFSPISMKYQAFLARNSIVLPPALGNISLTPSSKTIEEYGQIRALINRTRAPETEIKAIDLYDMVICGYDCEFIAVYDPVSDGWLPYQLRCKDDTVSLPTVELVYMIASQTRNGDIDAMFAMPAPISSAAPHGEDSPGAARPKPSPTPSLEAPSAQEPATEEELPGEQGGDASVLRPADEQDQGTEV